MPMLILLVFILITESVDGKLTATIVNLINSSEG